LTSVYKRSENSDFRRRDSDETRVNSVGGDVVGPKRGGVNRLQQEHIRPWRGGEGKSMICGLVAPRGGARVGYGSQ